MKSWNILQKILLLALSMQLSPLLVNAESVLTISFYSEETYKLSLANKPEITFEGDDFVIKGKDILTSFPRQEIKEFYFDKSSSVKEVSQDMFKIEWETDRLINLYGENLIPIQIFDLQGRSINVKIRDEGNKVILDLERIEAGTYILIANNKRNIKIILR